MSINVSVRENNVDQALRALKKKLQREGFFGRIKEIRYHTKPSEKRKQKKANAERRRRKMARKYNQS